MSERAVSPVIAVVLLVGITVVLVATVAVTVLGFGDDLDEPGPQVAFEYDYDGDSDTLTITHQSGDSFEAGDVQIKWGGKTVTWAEIAGASRVSTGSSVRIGDYDVDGSGTVESFERVGSDEKVFVVHAPNPEATTLLDRRKGDDS